MTDSLLTSLWLSLRVAVMATALATVVAIPLAHLNARKRYAGKSLVEGLLVMPMVLPPTVVGYLILILLGSHGWIGHFLKKWFDYSILFSIEGAVLAASVVALPLLYLPARAALASIEREMEDIARVMGANRWQIFWHVSLPLASRGILSGLMLAFARALGEFGATAMVYGIRSNDSTLPVSIYVDYTAGTMENAWPAVVVLFAVSLAMTAWYNRSHMGKFE